MRRRTVYGSPITDFYSIANGYDLVSIIKQAVEANGGKTDGPTIAKWVIEHPDDLKLLTVKRHAATAQNHFMFGPDNFVLIENPTKRDKVLICSSARAASKARALPWPPKQ